MSCYIVKYVIICENNYFLLCLNHVTINANRILLISIQLLIKNIFVVGSVDTDVCVLHWNIMCF